METKKVSIIMGIYNCEKYLNESIESILQQTYKNWELIMCDDGSEDNTYYIARKYEEKYPEKIIVLKNTTNRGLNYTLNKCLKKAKGEYIARQDGDDISVKNRLEKEVEFLNNNPNYALVSTNMIYFDENSEWGSSKVKEIPEKLDFVKGTPFCHAPCMIRKGVIESVNGYTEDKKLLRVEDYHLWFKIYEKGYKGYNMQECLYKMRNNAEAVKRRTWKNRINEARVKYIGFKMLNIPIKYRTYIVIPILKMMIPTGLYKVIYKYKNRRGEN